MGIGQQAQLLRTIARHWVKVEPDTVERLRRMVAGLTPKKAGMVAENHERLRRFGLDANIEVHVPPAPTLSSAAGTGGSLPCGIGAWLAAPGASHPPPKAR